jgi:hypothetical protein
MPALSRYAPPEHSAPRLQVGLIPSGYAGTMRTAEHVKRLIREGVKDFYVRQKAIDILLARRVPPKHYLGEIDALFRWVQRNVRYTKDPYRVEVLHSPRRMLELRAGDCDDMTILLGSMLESIGHPVRLILTGPDPRRPRLFSHIYLEVNHRGTWIPCDATMPHPMGWAPRTLVRRVIPIQEEPDHVSAIHGSDGSSGRPAMAVESHPRHPTRRRPAEGPARPNALGSPEESWTARAGSVAAGAAALHLGDGVDAAGPAERESTHQGAPPRLGDPAPGGDAGVRGRRPMVRGTTVRPTLRGTAIRGASVPPIRATTSATRAAPSAIRAVAPAGDATESAPDASSPPSAPGAGPAGRTGPADRPSGGRAALGSETDDLSGYLRSGAELYRGFTRFDPTRTMRVTHCRVMPPVVVQLGELVGLIYRSDKWCGEPRTYIHLMQTRPRLVSDVGGQQLYLVGGRYRVTPQGIEG